MNFWFLRYFTSILFIDLFQAHLFFFYNINVILIYLIFINLYTSFSIVIMTQNYYEQIISGHNNFVSSILFHNMLTTSIQPMLILKYALHYLSRYHPTYVKKWLSVIFEMKTNKNICENAEKKKTRCRSSLSKKT